MRCNNCGAEQQSNNSFCENCGSPLAVQQNTPPQNGYNQTAGQPQSGQGYNSYNVPPQGYGYSQPQNGQGITPPPPQYMQSSPQGYYGGTQENSKKPVASLVLGILSIICGGGIWGILAIVFGIIGRKEQKQRGLPATMAIVGIVLGIIGLIIGIYLYIFVLPNLMSELLFIR